MKGVLKNVDYTRYYKELLPYFQEERNKKYFFLILTFGASIFFLLFAISPTLSTIANLKKQIEDSKLVDNKLTTKISALSSLSQSYNVISQDLSYLTNAIPKVPDTTTLAAQIQGVADTTGVTVSNIQVSPVDLTALNQATASSALSFDVSTKGDYTSTRNFINGLINIQRVISVDSLSVSNGSAQDSSSIQADIKGTVFYKP